MNYKFLNDIFLRTPFYSFNRYDPDRIADILATTIFRNAIFLASPAFYRQLEKKEFVYDQLTGKEIFTLRKYYNRMCFRPVPFGSFAAITTLQWGDGEPVKLCSDAAAELHLLPDEALLAYARQSADPLAEDLSLIINPTLYKVGKEYRFIKSEPDPRGRYEFSLEAVPVQRFYISLFARINRKQITTAGLASWIAEFAACPPGEAADYVVFLLESQLLYHSRHGNIISKAHDPDFIADIAAVFEENRSSLISDIQPLSALSAKLAQTAPENINHFYAAAERKHECGGPGPALQQQLLESVHALQKLCLPLNPPSLVQFIADFKARFDLEKVPLLLALDPDAGIPYGNNSLSGFVIEYGKINFPEPLPKPETAAWTAQHRLLFNLWTNARRQGSYAPVIIDEKDLQDLEPTGQPAPSMAILFRETAGHLVIDYAGGISGTTLIGRFSAFSEATHEICTQLAAIEQAANPEILFADIAQFSDAHVDNINRRKQLYPCEIPINVYSEPKDKNVVKLSDLLIYVRNGQLLLESKKHGKRVVPRLATAYNHGHTGLNIFRLLCDIQHQGFQSSLNFSLGSFFPGMPYYPRVVYRQTVISPATWHFTENQLSSLTAPHALQSFREQHELPRHVSIGSSDQQLVFDLGDPTEAMFFLENLRSKKTLTLTEYFQPARTIKAGGKPLAGQYTAFLYHERKVYQPAAVPAMTKHKASRDFTPGSDWLYVKLFCTPESADTLLTGVIAQLIAKNEPDIACWFFIRYFENGHHLRLRIRSSKKSPAVYLDELHSAIEQSGQFHLIKNFQTDTYRRELERYGAAIIEQVEQFFCASSQLVLNYMQQQASGQDLPTELLFGLLIAHCLSECFETQPAKLTAFFQKNADQFIKGFHGGKDLKIDLDGKYRAKRKNIEQLLEQRTTGAAADLNKLLATTNHIARMTHHQPPETRMKLLADLIHMQLNRIFKIKHRQQELMVYYFLYKYMITVTAKAAKT